MTLKSPNSAKVYRDMENLIDNLFCFVDKFPKHYKALIGDRVLNSALLTMTCIAMAYSFDDKIKNIQDAIFYFNEMIIVLRIAHTKKLISNGQHSSIFKQITEVQQQLIKWFQYVKSKDDASQG